MPDLCEATAMDVARFGSWDDAVPPCGEPGEVEVDGYLLCCGCAAALRVVGSLAEGARIRRRVLAEVRRELLIRDVAWAVVILTALFAASALWWR